MACLSFYEMSSWVVHARGMIRGPVASKMKSSPILRNAPHRLSKNLTTNKYHTSVEYINKTNVLQQEICKERSPDTSFPMHRSPEFLFGFIQQDTPNDNSDQEKASI